MSELGDLLEALHGAHRSFTSVRLEAREWRHRQRSEDVWPGDMLALESAPAEPPPLVA